MRFALAGVLASATAASAGGAARGVPHGFRPETASGVGARHLWVLGEYRGGGTWCLAETALYATDDGGLTWQRSGPAADVRAFAAAGGYAYAVFGRERFERSPVGRNAWQKLSLPFSTLDGPLGLSAHGSHVWVAGTSPSRRPQFHSKLGLSDDRGSRFVVRTGPCEAGLPGGVTPAGQRDLRAVCSGGMIASLSLSTNDGRSFTIRSPRSWRTSTAQLDERCFDRGPSARVAVLTRGAGGAFLRTTDAGRRWSLVPKTVQTPDLRGANRPRWVITYPSFGV